MKSQKLINHFKKQPFERQLHFVFFATVAIIVSLAVLLTLVWRQVYMAQLKEAAYKDVSIISTNIAKRLTAVETLSFRIIDSAPIQNGLQRILAQDSLQSLEAIDQKNALSAEINALVRNESTIQNVYLFTPTNENMINFLAETDHIFNGQTIKDMIETLPDKPAKGSWFFAKDLSQGVYLRKIYSTADLSLTYIGTVIFLVNTSFFRNEIESLPIVSEQNQFFMAYQNQFYSTANDEQTLAADQNTLQQKIGTFQRSIGSMTFDNRQYYYAMDRKTMPNMTFIYLLPENQVLADLYKLQGLSIAVSLPFLCLIIVVIRKISNQLTRPLADLASQMAVLRKTKKLASLKTLAVPENSQEEIMVLYESYNTMIDELNALIKDNYEMRILSQEIEFKGLQAQLDPHFLYNTLDSINWIAIENQQWQISEMVTSLAYLFRKKIDTKSDFTTLQDELDIVHAYINIQNVRFGKRIEYIEVILVNDLSFKVPKLLIQPLIENVFKYAVNDMKETCRLVLTIEQQATFLQVSVSDNGPGFKANFSIEKEGGIGLTNIQKRLQLHYGDQASLAIVSSIPFKKTTVRFVIPLKGVSET
ncbi:sensor histidine kinase [Enterococcus casseliflavus]|uniref:sensor histidine kinase n=1 Tax=Enterococcus casseliflavus TaxID=37734 RepID=UPI00115DC1F5|nr:histidine kinase [Enterococcus casseliflavus]MDB1687083.1 histidine kinase [Enterococcus casseliflavus]